MDIEVDELEFKRTCLESERAALQVMKSLDPNPNSQWFKDKEDKLAWMEEEIRKLESGE